MAVRLPIAWDWDIIDNKFLVSNGLRALYGFPLDQVLNLEHFRGYSNSQEEAWINWVERAARREESSSSVAFTYSVKFNTNVQKTWLKVSIQVDRELGPHECIRGITGVIEDVTEQILATNSLIESEERLRLAVEAGKMAIWEVDLENGKVTNTRELNHLFGFPSDATPTLTELRSRYAPGEVERLAKDGATWEVVRKRFEAGEYLPRDPHMTKIESDRTQVQAEVKIVLPNHTAKNLLYRAQYAYSLEGRPKITGFLVDITERKVAEERLSIVIRELHHRFKNSITVISALAKQSFAKPLANSEMQTFLARLTALSNATNMILQNEGKQIDFETIVTAITEPYRSAQLDPFFKEGPTFMVNAKSAEAISMVIHELCINALKYGALSTPNGKIYVVWKVNNDNQLNLSWKETGGPEPKQIRQKGYGTKLIDALVTGELAGSVIMNFKANGLECTIEIGNSIFAPRPSQRL